MPETLIGTSRIFLFGRKMDDIQLVLSSNPVRLVATDVIAANGIIAVDGVATVAGDKVLLTKQAPSSTRGIYTVAAGLWARLPDEDQPQRRDVVDVEEGSPENRGGWIRKWTPDANKFRFRKIRPGRNTNLGQNHLLGSQFEGGALARIYGFSYDGTYYDLPRPTIFLVHGDGELVTDPTPVDNAARAPTDPTATGLAAADFQFADKLRVWSYDKADYTIRMDVETGMFEQVLLNAYFSDSPPVSGMRVSGMHVSGMHVSGMRVAGMRVSGMRASGARGRGDAGD